MIQLTIEQYRMITAKQLEIIAMQHRAIKRLRIALYVSLVTSAVYMFLYCKTNFTQKKHESLDKVNSIDAGTAYDRIKILGDAKNYYL